MDGIKWWKIQHQNNHKLRKTHILMKNQEDGFHSFNGTLNMKTIWSGIIIYKNIYQYCFDLD